MKPSMRACEINHKDAGIDSQFRMSSFRLSPATLAGRRNAHRYQTAFRSELTDSKRLISVRSSLNRCGSLDRHTARLAGQDVRHRYQTVVFFVGRDRNGLSGRLGSAVPQNQAASLEPILWSGRDHDVSARRPSWRQVSIFLEQNGKFQTCRHGIHDADVSSPGNPAQRPWR